MANKSGGGIALTHGFGLVVNFFAQISNNVTLFHGVTLGRRDRVSHEGERLTEYPILEDDVWVGLHATIVGRVIISRGSRIAGGDFRYSQHSSLLYCLWQPSIDCKE